MTGLLRRLALRAQGMAPTLAPRLPALFEPMAIGEDDGAPPHIESLHAGGQVSSPAQPASGPAQAAARPLAAARTSMAGPAAPTMVPPPIRPAAMSVAAPTPMVDRDLVGASMSSRTAAAQPANVPSAALDVPLPSLTATQRRLAAARLIPDQPAPGGTPASASTRFAAVPPAAARDAASATRAGELSADRAPGPAALPTTSPSISATAPVGAAPAGRGATSALPDPASGSDAGLPPVEIAIGRVEIRLAQPAQAAPAQARRPGPPPLDALLRRGRG